MLCAVGQEGRRPDLLRPGHPWCLAAFPPRGTSGVWKPYLWSISTRRTALRTLLDSDSTRTWFPAGLRARVRPLCSKLSTRPLLKTGHLVARFALGQLGAMIKFCQHCADDRPLGPSSDTLRYPRRYRVDAPVDPDGVEGEYGAIPGHELLAGLEIPSRANWLSVTWSSTQQNRDRALAPVNRGSSRCSCS